MSSRDNGPLDATDREIVRLLQRNGRASNTEIGRTLGLAEATIRKRIARMLDEGLVNVVAVPTPKAMGMPISAIIGISVNLGGLELVSQRLSRYPEVRYLGLSTGRYDIIIESFFDDSEHLLSFVSEKLGVLPEVSDVETSIILRVDKFSYEWELPGD